MHSLEKEVALSESEALHLEAAELMAEQRFDAVYDAAEQSGNVDGVTATAEFRAWIAARAATDAAWGRWAECMSAAAP
jgi:hypothetical protein